jgi:hypothetical protein
MTVWRGGWNCGDEKQAEARVGATKLRMSGRIHTGDRPARTIFAFGDRGKDVKLRFARNASAARRVACGNVRREARRSLDRRPSVS